MSEMITMPAKIGKVTQRQYRQMVARGRVLVGQQSRSQFALGDFALKIAPYAARRRRPRHAALADRRLRDRFTGKTIGAYLGLVPTEYSSGTT
ncbi:hypothetical protein ABZ412_27725 [Nocardia sp. NPDC005746]|uniref:hypothetical protein n=1 Tax=Nocardia sp. NPDC005746 TaxID=3157062 RepID=UPI0034097E9C